MRAPLRCVMMIPHCPAFISLSQADSHPDLIPWELVQRVILCSALLLGECSGLGYPLPGYLWPRPLPPSSSVGFACLCVGDGPSESACDGEAFPLGLRTLIEHLLPFIASLWQSKLSGLKSS